jgi:hypothetical protein
MAQGENKCNQRNEIVTFDNWSLTMKRSLGSTGSQEHEALLSNHKKRHISYRVPMSSFVFFVTDGTSFK